MIKIFYKFNADTLVVSDPILKLGIGDTIEIISDIVFPDKPADECMPLSWSLGQSSAGGKGTKCLDIIGEDQFKGTMTFEATGLGSGYIKYEVTDGGKYLNSTGEVMSSKFISIIVA